MQLNAVALELYVSDNYQLIKWKFSIVYFERRSDVSKVNLELILKISIRPYK